MRVLSELEPKNVFSFFEDICNFVVIINYNGYIFALFI